MANIDLENSIAALQSTNKNEHNAHPAWFWAIVIRTFYYTGIRRRQLVELRWEDINFDDATIHLRASSSKTHREWFIPIAEPLLAELENLLLVTIDRIQCKPPRHSQVFNVTLFHDRFKGKQMTVDQLSGAFERLSKALGVRITPHRLRHTMATELAARKDIRTCSSCWAIQTSRPRCSTCTRTWTACETSSKACRSSPCIAASTVLKKVTYLG